MNRFSELAENADACVISLNWFYALMVVVIIGGIWLEAHLERKSRRKRAR